MEKRIVHKWTQTSVDMDDEQTKPDGLTSLARVPHIRRKRKRSDIDNFDGVRKKQSKGVNPVEQEVESVDIISELPESVIHHIFSFIRCAKEAARTSILSKKWRDAWKSFSILTFDEQHFLKTEVNLDSDKRRQLFMDFIDYSLQSHLERNLSIYKLVFRITPELVLCLNRWVSIAARNGLGELDIHVEDKRLRRYNLSPFMCSAKTLTGLRLHGLNWSSFEGFPKLERIDLHRCYGTRRIELQVTSLQTFWYCATKSTRCKLNLESCTSLKRLTLEDPYMTDTFFNKLLSSFPDLEKLDLSRCNKFLYIEVSNLRLRSLVLRSCKNLKIVDIDTPNLCSFDYRSNNMACMLGQLCLKEAKFSLDSTEEVDLLRRNLIVNSFLRKHCRGFKIIILVQKNIIIHDDSKEIFLPTFHHLKIHAIKSSTDAKDLVDSLLSTWHPETLSVLSSPSSNVPKAVREIKREEDPSCCGYSASNNKCWRHFLEDAEIMNRVEIADVSSVWFLDLNYRCKEDQMTSIRLHWEPSVHIGKA
ncbi:putative FBD-associated F-box protein At5g22720 isoform X2 [Momordica charantia]|uniref:FBD-associated F-box protein At5g22720 isoform X2 n=1 Tax=Momordica charantia TaxID=3673 RepID=A0A6J1D3D3_MOMCH|nr:putative FBD-associated F-box protein At5g22720 isoform X2 [Momordica charantia]